MPLAFRTGSPRRAPYPFDFVVVNGTERMGFMVGAEKDGTGVASEKPQDQGHVLPTAYGYQAQSPILEAVTAYGQMSRGYGVNVQQSVDDRGYHYALGVDCSAGIWQKGPEVTLYTPGTIDGAATKTRMFEIGGYLFWAHGRYVTQRTSNSTSTVFLDAGSGKAVQDVEVFEHTAFGGLKYAYLAMGDAEAVWRIGPTPEVQTIAVSGGPLGGTYRLQWVNGGTTYTTDALAYNATAADVQAALRQFTGLEGVEVVSAGTTPNYTHAVTFFGFDADPAQLTSNITGLTGGAPAIAHATPTAYVALAASQCVEQQTVTVSGTPAGGTYTLSYGTQTTGALVYNATPGAVQTALRLLTGLSAVTVTAVGTSPDYTHTVRFVGVGGNATLLSSVNGLTGGASPTIAHATVRAPLFARAFKRKGREFQRANGTNLWAKCDPDSDPQYEENWSADYPVGDRTQGINRIAASSTGTTVIFKPDQPYSLDQFAEEVPLLPALARTPDASGGECFGEWMNDMYVGYGKALYKITPDLVFHEVGPDKLILNQSPVQGVPTAVSGHETFNLYCALWNPDTNAAYLMKFGSWSEFDKNTTPQGGERTEVWHGSVTPAYTSDKITALYKSTIGAPTDHSRLYMHFLSGKVRWFTLPCTPNPVNCSNYRFTTDNTELRLPTWHAMFQANVKALRGVSISAFNFTTTDYATVEYRDNPTSTAFTAMATPFNLGQLSHVDFGLISATLLDIKVVLHSSVNTSTPQLTGLGLHHQLHTDLRQVFTETVLVADGLVKRDGRPFMYGATAMRDFLTTAANTPAGVTVLLADQTSRVVKLVDWKERLAWDARTRKWRSALTLVGTEVSQSGAYGLYSHLEALTYGAMEAFTYAQLEQL